MAICNELAAQFNDRYGREFGAPVDVKIVDGASGFHEMISRSGTYDSYDVWLGGEPRYHELALEKEIVENIRMVTPSWGRERNISIPVSIPTRPRHYKLTFLFTDWLEYDSKIDASF